MNLEEFIAEAISQIASGIKKGKTEAAKQGVFVAFPCGFIPTNQTLTCDTKGGTHPFLMEFDIAVTAGEKSSGEIKGGLSVLKCSLGGSGVKEHSQDVVSRLKFQIPVIWQWPHTQGKTQK